MGLVAGGFGLKAVERRDQTVEVPSVHGGAPLRQRAAGRAARPADPQKGSMRSYRGRSVASEHALHPRAPFREDCRKDRNGRAWPLALQGRQMLQMAETPEFPELPYAPIQKN